MNINEIKSLIKAKDVINKNFDLNITGIKPITIAGINEISFIFKSLTNIPEIRASAIVVKHPIDTFSGTQFIHDSPRLAMALLLSKLYPTEPITPTIHANSTVDKSAIIEANVTIHANVVIGKRTIVKSGAMILPGVVIGNDCFVGKNSILHANATIQNNTSIGKDCIIHSGAVIGSDGFGYEKNKKNNQWIKIPHIGNVVIEDMVEIGSNSCIDKGCLEKTIIKKGTKIDNHVHIGHNCSVGENVVIAGGCLLSGSVSIDDGCIVAGDVSFSDGISIGKNTTILGNSKVTKSIDAQKIISGFPATDHKEELKFQAFLRRLFKSK